MLRASLLYITVYTVYSIQHIYIQYTLLIFLLYFICKQFTEIYAGITDIYGQEKCTKPFEINKFLSFAFFLISPLKQCIINTII